MKLFLPVVIGLVWYPLWLWTAALLDPFGLGEFLFVGRFCLTFALLSLAEALFKRYVP